MAKHPEIPCLLFALLFSYVSRFTSSIRHAQYAHQPPPRRFFPASSLIIDLPYGNIGDIGQLQPQYEVLFVMYYAPWCAKSRRVKTEFEKAALYLRDEVQFVAINCWYPGGQCRQQNSFAGFPEIYLYHTHLNGFKYSGILTAEYLVAFLQAMLRPFSYLRHQVDVASFLAVCDPPGFQQFYYAAMRSIETDPINSAKCFGVFTDARLAQRFSMQESPSVSLVRVHNGTLKYSSSRNFTASALTQWYFLLRQDPVVQWILPTGSKSKILSTEMKKGPAIVLFTPNHPLSGINFHFSQLRDIALTHRNCKNGSHIADIIQRSSYLRWTSVLNQVEVSELCAHQPPSVEQPPVSQFPATKSCCLSLSTAAHNSCSACLNYHSTHPQSGQPCPILGHIRDSLLRDITSSKTCSESMLNYNPSEYISVCCDASQSHTVPNIRDPYMTRSSKLCHKHRLRRQNGWGYPALMHMLNEVSFPQDYNRCSTNSTLNFYAMDTRRSESFAQRLGLHQIRANNGTALVIVNIHDEAQYVFSGALTPSSMMNFIYRYSKQDLERSFRSANHMLSPDKCNALGVTSNANKICIREVTSQHFNEVVMDPTKDVVLLYYAPWCGFCSAFSHVFLSLAKYFQSSKNLIFARFNGDLHDLPWEFTTDIYPAITLYPAKRKMDSVSFPDHLEKSLVNLVRFVLQHSTYAVRRDTAVSACSAVCMRTNIDSAVRHVRDMNIRHAITKHRASGINQSKRRSSAYQQYLLQSLSRYQVQTNATKAFVESIDEVLTFQHGKMTLLRALKRDFKGRSEKLKKIKKFTFEQALSQVADQL
ncbi:hypothetical protein CAPTEDRAFT_221464 [Capitella teleta]|uniref:Thioredoxin domain-containing protein n=1 Tax=Capitella teleta TaxID=283909 RepID=R7TV91_CAPTE|nr:hypothetical protein CAPTEDRAFT_221464 [Capitella teleta]|eukprot:ELT97507.1 hypothetical protein CAPTEDRAFT_221464 [Capitella teleta]